MIGIDYGVRRVAIALIQRGEVEAYDCTKDSARMGWDRAGELYEMGQWAKLMVGGMQGPIFVESPIGGMSGNMQTLAGMAETCGALLSCFPGRAHKVAPSSWKALVCGNGSFDKARVSAWLQAEHPSLYDACLKPSGKVDQDRVDAACLGLCTVAGLAERSSMPRKRSRPVLRGGSKAADEPGRGR